MADTERAHSAYADHYSYEMTPNGNTGIALLERAANIMRERAPLPDDIDALMGWMGLILIDLATKPKSDSANAADMWAKSLRG